jgi:hypothetical protein
MELTQDRDLGVCVVTFYVSPQLLSAIPEFNFHRIQIC